MKLRFFLLYASIFVLPLFFPATAADTALGRNTYMQHCSSCHGIDGSPNMAAAPDFKRGQGLMQSDLSLLRRIQTGKNACPAYLGILGNQQILDVIAYIRILF